MRRTIIPLSLLAAALCVLAVAGSAGASARAPRIVCPVSNAQIVPCCPLPPRPAGGSSAEIQPICCQPTTCCTVSPTVCCTDASACCPSGGCCPTPCTTGSLTIAAAPNPSTAGRKVVISGAFVGNPVSGAQVVLWDKLAGHSSFQKLAQTTTDSSGRYTFTLGGTVMTDQAWYAASNGVHSATLEQHVNALVGLSSSTHAATVGRAVRLRGHVTPSHAGETVLIEQRRGGAWRAVARAKLGRTSSYSISHRFSQHGTVRLRAVLAGDARNDRSVSSTFTLTVKA